MGFLSKLKGAVPTPGQFEMRDRAMNVHQNGVNVNGTLTALEPTGREDFGGGVEHRISVQVQPEGGEAYDVTFTQALLPGMMGAWTQPGSRVSLRVDPADRSQAILMGGA